MCIANYREFIVQTETFMYTLISCIVISSVVCQNKDIQSVSHLESKYRVAQLK